MTTPTQPHRTRGHGRATEYRWLTSQFASNQRQVSSPRFGGLSTPMSTLRLTPLSKSVVC